MMKSFPFWLIQRGHVRKDLSTPAKCLDDLIRWDYMGHAEFEFGALGGSLVRILHRFNQYKTFTTDLVSADGKRVVVFTRDESIPQKVVTFADRPNPWLFDLKDPSYLEDIRKNDAYANKFLPSFWFCIDDSTERRSIYNNGDWMAMFEDDVPAVLQAMAKEKAAWDNLSAGERQMLLRKWMKGEC